MLETTCNALRLQIMNTEGEWKFLTVGRFQVLLIMGFYPLSAFLLSKDIPKLILI